MQINIKKYKASNLELVKYSLLQALFENPKLLEEMDEATKEFCEFILECEGYVRVVDNTVILEPKAKILFENKIDVQAKELLAYFNEMKKTHFGINRLTVADKYVTKFKSLLKEHSSIEYIKRVLEYCASTWKEDSFWRSQFNVDTLCRHFDKYADKYELQDSELENSMFERMEDD
ncbi:MAG: hypothetical protein GY775_16840 [Candidatus Scalindua sp.]|nr:hypothetical protein [Candidatus Scalindua sp.]